MKDRDFVYCEVRQEAPGGLYIIYGESLSDDEAAQARALLQPHIKKFSGTTPCNQGLTRIRHTFQACTSEQNLAYFEFLRSTCSETSRMTKTPASGWCP